MKALIAIVAALGLGSVVATIWIGSRVREPTVVANPYEEGLRYDEARRPAAQRGGSAADAERSEARATAKGELALSISPEPPRAMTELTFTVRATRGGAPLDGADVAIALTMPAMYMGENRIALSAAGGGLYRGTGTVVRCPSGKRTWVAEVSARPADGGAPISDRFPLEVRDP